MESKRYTLKERIVNIEKLVVTTLLLCSCSWLLSSIGIVLTILDKLQLPYGVGLASTYLIAIVTIFILSAGYFFKYSSNVLDAVSDEMSGGIVDFIKKHKRVLKYIFYITASVIVFLIAKLFVSTEQIVGAIFINILLLLLKKIKNYK
ncbi:MAG: hypothetical protein MSIBF_05045 [Candidatus Altiarchaeales archaeon IMC4]|nr:MAG: hypothetical protein MSIBF_05045 [Candidatus Altiarchaeales archaeon IMC4]